MSLTRSEVFIVWCHLTVFPCVLILKSCWCLTFHGVVYVSNKIVVFPRTCSTFSSNGGFCSALDTFPNATIAEYGEVVGARRMMAEIHTRGPIACGVDATYLEEYQNGVLDAGKGPFQIDHIISVVGWGTDAETGKKYWVVRNSWGEYWGECHHHHHHFSQECTYG